MGICAWKETACIFLSQDLGMGASLVAQLVKNRLQCARPGFNSCVGKMPWKRKWRPTPVFWRILVGYSPWGHEESDLTE